MARPAGPSISSCGTAVRLPSLLLINRLSSGSGLCASASGVSSPACPPRLLFFNAYLLRSLLIVSVFMPVVCQRGSFSCERVQGGPQLEPTAVRRNSTTSLDLFIALLAEVAATPCLLLPSHTDLLSREMLLVLDLCFRDFGQSRYLTSTHVFARLWDIPSESFMYSCGVSSKRALCLLVILERSGVPARLPSPGVSPALSSPSSSSSSSSATSISSPSASTSTSISASASSSSGSPSASSSTTSWPPTSTVSLISSSTSRA